MPKGDKYLGLRNYLEESGATEIQLTFDEIEKINHHKLPPSAFNHSESWWSNNRDHSQGIAWLDAGYETDFVTVTYEQKYIVFVKQNKGLR
jgi:hypothetical protein